MAMVITLSRQFLQGHPKAGQPTNFVRAAWKSMHYPDFSPFATSCVLSNEWSDYAKKHGTFLTKHHTIRFGRRWKTGDKASLRVWSGIPYRSPQVAISPDVTLRVVDVWVDYDQGEIYEAIGDSVFDDSKQLCELKPTCPKISLLAANDGLSPQDFLDWFGVGKKTGLHPAQILIWGKVTDY